MLNSICVHFDSSPAALTRGRVALELAQRLKASIRGLVVSAPPMAAYGFGAEAVGAAFEQIQANIAREAAATQARAKAELGIDADILDTLADRVITDVASVVRADDFILIAPPRKDIGTLDGDVFEAALFASGRPVILVPPEWTKPIGKRVVIAWKDCREAARAVHDALPILQQAEHVRIVSVVSHEEKRFFGQAAFDRMSAMLRARGVVLEDKLVVDEPNAGAALLREAADADLLVMGGYGNWRIGEYLFGGVTRHALTHLGLPVLMSR